MHAFQFLFQACLGFTDTAPCEFFMAVGADKDAALRFHFQEVQVNFGDRFVLRTWRFFGDSGVDKV